MQKRKGIGNKLRFEVFKRDKFTCQYCGKAAPDVLLQVDHIEPVADGGSNDMLNLITSCFECNSGKGARLLNDDAVMVRQRGELRQLQERREQIEMMFEWKQELLDLENNIANQAAEYWNKRMSPINKFLNECGINFLAKLIRQYGIDQTTAAMQIAADHYLTFTGNEDRDVEIATDAFAKIEGVCKLRTSGEDLDRLKQIFGLRKYLQKCIELDSHQWRQAFPIIESAIDAGVPAEDIKQTMQTATSFWRWQREMEELPYA